MFDLLIDFTPLENVLNCSFLSFFKRSHSLSGSLSDVFRKFAESFRNFSSMRYLLSTVIGVVLSLGVACASASAL